MCDGKCLKDGVIVNDGEVCDGKCAKDGVIVKDGVMVKCAMVSV